MLEKDLERKLTEAVRKSGGLCMKLTMYKGIPDRLVLLNGKVAFVELKREGMPLRPEQEVWQRRLRTMGFEAKTIDNTSKISSLISFLNEV